MIDRLDDLRAACAAHHATRGARAARSTAAGAVPLRSPEPSPPPTPQIPSAFRREDPLTAFLSKLENVRTGPLHELEGSLGEASQIHKAALCATTAAAEKQALLQAEACAAKASKAAARTSQELRSLAAEPSSGVLPGGSEAALRRQALAGVSVLFQNALNSYFQAQVSFRQEMEAKVSRQLRAAFPEAEESVVEAVAAGRSAASTIQEAMQRQSGTAPLTTANALQATRERCDELASLARAARDLSQLFIDVESLVNSQGEILNDIGSHIASTRESTKRGHDELLRASAQQSACRWRWLALGLLVVIAVLIIIFTVLEHQPSHSLRTEELPAGQSAPHHWGGRPWPVLRPVTVAV
ncbi:unnamed protein product [Durusdinium trenchii]|uniref:t-SNARE coiled-coil homology domain-containing protein n=1 Tax=Durusdinium trenchii TaxID=1381693 RepID=A0ABP0HG56_9DINO